MPLSFAGFMSRGQLTRPEPPPTPALPFETVLKFNPYHEKGTGRFTHANAGGGMRQGGTEGPPTHDAFGGKIQKKPAGSRAPTQARFDVQPAMHLTKEQMHANYRTMHGKPHPSDPNFNQGEGDPELAGSVPYKHTGGRQIATTPQARLAELDAMTADYSKQLDEKGIGKRSIRQVRDSLGMIQRERTGLQRQMHPDTPARIKDLTAMEHGYASQLGEKGLGKRASRQIKASLGMIRRERTSLTYKPR